MSNGCDHKFVDSNSCLKCGWVSPKTFSVDECIKMLANVGVDTTCGACMALAFTGSAIEPHTCKKV